MLPAARKDKGIILCLDELCFASLQELVGSDRATRVDSLTERFEKQIRQLPRSNGSIN